MKQSAAGALALIFAVLFVGIAFGHSRPIRLEPAPGVVLDAGPGQVTGWFTQPLRRDPNWTYIQVTDAQGARVDTGDVMLSDDRKQMTVNLNSNLPDGRYLVTWRGWDDNDGAIFGDCYAFFIGQDAADAAISGNTRLDGGSACQRIDVSAREGTPVAGGTPQTTATAEGHNDAGEADVDPPADGAINEADDGGDIPTWGLILGVAGGLAVGGVGGRLVGNRS